MVVATAFIVVERVSSVLGAPAEAALLSSDLLSSVFFLELQP
jgi:hypothetical protein